MVLSGLKTQTKILVNAYLTCQHKNLKENKRICQVIAVIGHHNLPTCFVICQGDLPSANSPILPLKLDITPILCQKIANNLV